ncbi:hypothetical protein WIW50_19610 [Flavobacteriaceae bacterium 3-367]
MKTIKRNQQQNVVKFQTEGFKTHAIWNNKRRYSVKEQYRFVL